MTAEELTNPHDKFFREMFSRKEIAQGFITEHLPDTVRNQLDFTTLEIVKDSYVDNELTAHYSDILYKISISGKSAFIYLLFEHKSYIDRTVSFQLLRNMVKIWEQHFKQNKRAKKLPCIITPWKAKEGFSPLFDAIESTEWYIPDFSYELFDISHIPEDTIKGDVLEKAVLLLLRCTFDPQRMQALPQIFELIGRLSSASKVTEYIELFIRYLVSTVESGEEKELRKVITKSIKYGGKVMPTIAEKWLQEGIEKGIEKNQIEIVHKMAENGMGNTGIRKITGLSLAKIEQILRQVKKK
jgi:predicted transposase/invertase (TIGR01784 family)